MDNNDTDLLHLLFKLEWQLRRLQMTHLRDRGPGASPYRGQGRILALLKLKPEISQRELAGILDIRSQSLGELLAKLEKAGYISRSASEADRRVMEIRLTDAGRAAAETEDAADPADSLFDCLDESEQAQLGDYLQRLIARLEAQLGPMPEGGFDPRRGFGPPREGFGPRDGHHHGRGPGFGGFHGEHRHRF